MKIFLIVPGCADPKQTYREYPLGAGLIATALRQQGCDVAIYDQNVEGPDDDLLWDRAGRFSPDIVGLSVITPAYPAAQRQIRALRRERPQVVIVAGGIHAGLFPEDLLADGADAVILGDGCDAMTALVKRWGQERPCQGLPGSVCLAADGRAVRTPPSSDNRVRWNPGIIDRDVYNLPLYTHHSMLASLGCPYQCTFCCNYSGTVLTGDTILLSYDRLCREMHYLEDRYVRQQVFFVDDIFLLKPANVLGFCRRVEQERFAMQWIAQMRADTVGPNVAEAMTAAGCRRICLGVEAGSEAILRRIRKGIDRETIRRGVRIAKDAGLRVKTGWIFGLPGTLQEQYESLAFMRELRPHENLDPSVYPLSGHGVLSAAGRVRASVSRCEGLCHLLLRRFGRQRRHGLFVSWRVHQASRGRGCGP